MTTWYDWSELFLTKHGLSDDEIHDILHELIADRKYSAVPWRKDYTRDSPQMMVVIQDMLKIAAIRYLEQVSPDSSVLKILKRGSQ